MMNKTIHLLYFNGCPNVEQARENLRTALIQAGREPVWSEVNLRAETTPERWRGFPSPTVLVEGRDIVTGADSAMGTGACRFSGAPGVQVISAHLNGSKWGLRREVARFRKTAASEKALDKTPSRGHYESTTPWHAQPNACGGADPDDHQNP